MKSASSIILYLAVCLFVTSNRGQTWKGHIFVTDKAQYHIYLPAIFIYNDLAKMSFYEKIDEYYRPVGDYKWYGLAYVDGNRVNKYSLGVALHELPFFLIAHWINTTFNIDTADGYSPPYQLGAILSGLFYVVIGLVFLRKVLRNYYNDTVVALTLLGISFGSNLYHYTVFDVGMSHPYSFFQFSFILYSTDLLYRTSKNKYLYYIAIGVGLAVITRVTTAIVILIPILWGINNIDSIKNRFTFWGKKLKHLLLALIVGFIVLGIQLSYWKYTSGSWIYYSYGEESFVWSEPKIFQGLFGFRKGWFVYTPIAFFAVLGLFIRNKAIKYQRLAIIVFMVINVYIIFSWWNWWYGGGYGSRPLIEAMAIMALPLAALINYIIGKRRIILNITGGIVFSICIYLSMFKAYQILKGTYHYDSMTAEYYFKAFFSTKYKPEFEQYQIPPDEYYEELGHRFNANKREVE